MYKPESINNTLRDKVFAEYQRRFGTRPDLVIRSPGRINLIGEHTDYNDGLVMPSAVGQGIYFAVGHASGSAAHQWYAMDKNAHFEVGTDEVHGLLNDWQDFVYGAWKAMSQEGGFEGAFRCVFGADLPIGSGMSSSSALTCGILFALNTLQACGLSAKSLAEIAHDVERNYVGLKGGIMDQYASLLSQPDQFLLLDCRDRSTSLVPFSGEQVSIFLIHSKVHRVLTSSGYNDRADECARALKILNERAGIQSLREATQEILDDHKDRLGAVLVKRIRYTIQENERVREMVTNLHRQDWSTAGEILLDGHDGLSNMFEVSTAELDFLAEYARNTDWIYGARMMGGGFGGCTINLATRGPDEAFVERLRKEYFERFGIRPELIPVELAGGACIL